VTKQRKSDSSKSNNTTAKVITVHHLELTKKKEMTWPNN